MQGDLNRVLTVAELLALVQASLKHKVESLDEDKWMYEAEEEVHG